MIDLDMPVELDQESFDALERETRQFVFNVLFVALVVVGLIVRFATR